MIGTVENLRDTTSVDAAHGGTVVEWLVEDGDPVSPASRCCASTRPGSKEPRMTTIKASIGAPFARILRRVGGPVARGRQRRDVHYIDSSDEWIQQRTGIVERRWVGEGETVETLSLDAARQAIERPASTASDIDAVIVSTVTHFLQTPALAAAARRPSSASTDAAAFDISAACAGFCYGLALAESLVRSAAGHARRCVIGVETLSELTDLDDRSHRVPVRRRRRAPSSSARARPTASARSSGAPTASQADVITQTADWRDGGRRAASCPHSPWRASAVFRWATGFIAEAAKHVLEAAGLTPDELDVFVPHQANNRITDAMLRHLKLPEHVVVARTIKKFGNTSAASIPIAIDALLDQRRGQERRDRPDHRLRRRARLRRPGRHPSLTPPADPSGTSHPTDRRRKHMATTEEIRAQLAELVNDVAGVPVEDVQLDKSFVDDLDVDSLAMVEIIVGCEEKFGVTIPDEESKNLKTVGDAVAYIEAHQLITADARAGRRPRPSRARTRTATNRHHTLGRDQ